VRPTTLILFGHELRRTVRPTCVVW